jgi:hypothetical protein
MMMDRRRGRGGHGELCNSYLVLLRFVVPLACVNFIHDLSEQVVDAGIAHDPSPEQVTATLAAFGVCWYLCVLTTHTIRTVQQVALVLGRSSSGRSSITRVYACAAVCAACAFVAVGALGGCSDLIFGRIHRLSGETLRTARLMIAGMAGFPPIVAVRAYYSGVLSAQKATTMISVGAMLNVVGVCATVGLLKLAQPTGASWVGWEPVLALYVGELLDLATVVAAARHRHRRRRHKRQQPRLGAEQLQQEEVSVCHVLRFAVRPHQFGRAGGSCFPCALIFGLVTALSSPIGRG